MTQQEKAEHFRTLHRPGTPLVLYNIWDAGSAKTVAAAGARAVATGSWSVAAAHGYDDGESMPLEFSLEIVRRIARSVPVPLSVDFESGYAEHPDQVALNLRRLIGTGAIGVNFEDRKIGGSGLYTTADQSARLQAMRAAADEEAIPVFLNARTDLFLKAAPAEHTPALLEDALTRATAYAAAGADGFFVPGLTEPTLIRHLCDRSPLPVNVLTKDETVDIRALAALGVSRISFGPAPHLWASQDLERRCKVVLDQTG